MYYDENAEHFYLSTVGLDMSALQEKFLNGLPKEAHLLDAGCGSGRDVLAFRQAGYRVSAFDASSELASLATMHSGVDVAVRRFEDVDEVEVYDGVWCCASLLHVPLPDMGHTINLLWKAIKPTGRLFMSFKYGTGEAHIDGRTFTYASPLFVRQWLSVFDDCVDADIWLTDDVRGTGQQWVNAIAFKEPK